MTTNLYNALTKQKASKKGDLISSSIPVQKRKNNFQKNRKFFHLFFKYNLAECASLT